MSKVRVRFAPSPTGPLHIGGVRTALYTYLIAKKYHGDFILRIEDTDLNRFVPGAEEYIIKSLEWCGMIPDEGPGFGGAFGPYRQSERKEIYEKYAKTLIESGKAYYAFDSIEEIETMRENQIQEGNKAPKYDYSSRMSMKNSLTLTENEVSDLLKNSENTIIRLKVNPGNEIVVNDLIRGEVTFKTEELDDKVLMKADGMPTYHLANIIDDHLMEVSHVIRGEEWLPSAAHHVLLYKAFNWEETMPAFAHLPLILKPDGKGKLSKRDGAKFGFPVFPMNWEGENPEDSFIGFKEFGFDPKATINFLAFLGWNPGNEQELFGIEELIESFNLSQIVKSGARFDIDKAKWFNQQYIIKSDDVEIAAYLKLNYPEIYGGIQTSFLEKFASLMKERVELYTDFFTSGYYFFEDIKEFEEKIIRSKWNENRAGHLTKLIPNLLNSSFQPGEIKLELEKYIKENEIGFGDVMPFLRIGISGTMKGPDLFEMMGLMGKEMVEKRLDEAIIHFNNVVADK